MVGFGEEKIVIYLSKWLKIEEKGRGKK